MLRIGLERITTKALFMVTVSVQIDTDVLSLDAADFVKKCRLLFSFRRALQSTALCMKHNQPFSRLLFVDSILCGEPAPTILETIDLIFTLNHITAVAK